MLKSAGDGAEVFMWGKCPFNIASRTTNSSVGIHLDSTDLGPTLIISTVSGEGKIHGGEFALPSLGLRLVPGTCTMILVYAAALPHGTAPLAAESMVQRRGYALFNRWEDLERLSAMQLHFDALGSSLEKEQQRVWEELELAKGDAAKTKDIQKAAMESRRWAVEGGRELAARARRALFWDESDKEGGGGDLGPVNGGSRAYEVEDKMRFGFLFWKAWEMQGLPKQARKA